MYLIVFGVIIIVLSVFGGWFWAGRKALEDKRLRVVFFALYFWLLVFAQLGLGVLGYYVFKSVN